ncbi:hypothetical protein NHQ30_008462 [Ciborinia camelliae]|nr:hypothetical protein NHQ30_008462 [Ciborinia camelliae]
MSQKLSSNGSDSKPEMTFELDSASDKRPENAIGRTPAAAAPAGPPGPFGGIVPVYPSPPMLALIFVSLILSMFLVALDMSIIATAIPTITARFQSIDQVGWYGSAFFLTLAAFVSFWGKVFKHTPIKWSFLVAMFIFELGSLICAVAPSSAAFIVGRAIQGLGGSGVTGGVYTLIAYVAPMPKVPAYMGMMGFVFSIASVVGPLLGGALTQHASWRWCFYINLPIGGVAALLFVFAYRSPPQAAPAKIPLKQFILNMDIPGIILLLGSLTCFFLALEWGGATKAWSSSDVIGVLVGFAVLLIAFIANEWRSGEKAILVPRILKNRTLAACAAFVFLSNNSGFVRVYNMPIYFQAVDGVSPTESGIRVLPTILSISLFTMFGAGAVGKLGWIQPFLIAGAAFATIGGGLIHTFDINTSVAKFVGYQIIAGMGVGLAIQVPIVTAQTISKRQDMPVASSNMLFFQFVGAATGVACGQSIFNNQLIEALPRLAPDVDVQTVLDSGAQGLSKIFPDPVQLEQVLMSYIVGLRAAWAFSIALSGLAFIVAFMPRWENINKVRAANMGVPPPSTSKA